MRKTLFGNILTFLLVSTFILASNVGLVRAQAQTIYINSDGSVSPSSAPISTVDNVTYIFTGNISYPAYNGIVVERNNIVIDGNGYAVQGTYLSGNGLTMTGISNVTVENAIIEGFQFGINLESSSGSIVSGNDVAGNVLGILLNSSSYNTVSGNNITANIYEGIWSLFSSNISVSGNNVTSSVNACGIELEGASNSSASENSVTSSFEGICLSSCSNTTVSGNNVTANSEWGIEINSYSNDTVIGNTATANRLSGIFLENVSDSIVSGNDATENGQMGIDIDYSSNNNTVSGNTATANNFDGIFLFVASNNTVSGNTATANSNDGIYLEDSSNDNSVCGNNVTSNKQDGIVLTDSSDQNTLSGNNVATNINHGILLNSSYDNVLSDNSITNSEYGIELYSLYPGSDFASYDNLIFHNNFVNNTNQAIVDLGSVGNSWDDGYPSGGNYWSDYNGTDFFNGPHQNVTGSDGIGDAPYHINANNTDNYPLMGAFSDFNVAPGVNVQVVSNSTVSDFQFNGTAILFNVSGVNGTAGFCNVRVPTSLLNGTITVFVNGTQVQYSLLPSSNSSISNLYFTYGHSTEQVTILPEFPESLIVAMFLAMLSAVAVHKKKHSHS
jgi:parallel beta-helix repeat protein